MDTNILKIKLKDLFNFDRIDILLESFNKATGFVTAILDLEGNILSKSGWRQICTDFHRVHPETSARCTESDTIIAGKLNEGEYFHYYKCLNGLVDVAVPIKVNGEHIGNIFTGQFFFEEPSKEFFKKQAREYGFDEKSYMMALEKVPVISESQVNLVMDFLLNMTKLISDMSLQRVEQIELNDALRKSEERWQFAIEGNGDGLWDWNVQTNEVFFSAQWKAMLGFREDEIKCNLEEWEKRVHPDDKKKVNYDLQKHFDGETEVYINEHRILCKDGTYKWILDRGKVISRTEDNKPLRVIGIHTDITEQKETETDLTKHRNHLEELVKERTAELEEKNIELENYNKLFTGREFRIKELKDRIKELEKLIPARGE